MNIFQLNCFLAVTNTLSFARAAEQLNVTQPTITHQIKTLENELNVKLFRRSTRLVEITPEGQSFIGDARSMVAIAERTKIRFSTSEEHPIVPLSIGCSSYMELILLTEILYKFNTEISNFHPRLKVVPRDQLLRLLESEQIDVYFNSKENTELNKNIKYRDLAQSELCCICRHDHHLATKEYLTITELMKESLIFCDPVNLAEDITKLQFRLAENHLPKDIHFCSTIDAALVLAASGTGIAFLPEMHITNDSNIVKIPLEDAPKLSFGLFYKSFPGDSVLRKFIRTTKLYFQEKYSQII